VASQSGLDEFARALLTNARTYATATPCLSVTHLMVYGRVCHHFLTAALLVLPQLKGGEAHTCVSLLLAHMLN
jgi:hypothetical protein